MTMIKHLKNKRVVRLNEPVLEEEDVDEQSDEAK
jgi:hypothetical protein